jgi:hypothetical protein
MGTSWCSFAPKMMQCMHEIFVPNCYGKQWLLRLFEIKFQQFSKHNTRHVLKFHCRKVFTMINETTLSFIIHRISCHIYLCFIHGFNPLYIYCTHILQFPLYIYCTHILQFGRSFFPRIRIISLAYLKYGKKNYHPYDRYKHSNRVPT